MTDGSQQPMPAQGAPEYRYWAFISYSHDDEAACRWLHAALERYRIPRHLVGRRVNDLVVPRRLFPVFRDRDELPGSAELGPSLQRALAQSRTQIVICSPHSARSRWVNEEIRYFKSLGRADRVLALIVGGEPHAGAGGEECFPQALRQHFDAGGNVTGDGAEPIAADLRPGGDGRLNAKLKLVSGLLGVGFDELRQRDLQARNRRLSIFASLAVLIAAVTIVLAVQATRARDEARRQQDLAEAARHDAERRQLQAEDLIEFMLGDLRAKLEPIGRLEILDAVGQKAMDHFATLDERDLTDAALASRATALRQIGDVRLRQGQIDAASNAFEQALKLDRALAARYPRDLRVQANAAESLFAVGHALYTRGEVEQARRWMERYAEAAQGLLALDASDAGAMLASVHASMNLGAIAAGQQRIDEALAHFSAARQMQTSLLDRDPDNADHVATLIGVDGWLASLHGRRRDWPQALAVASEQLALTRQRIEREPDNAVFLQEHVKALHYVLFSEGRQRVLPADHPALIEALAITAALHRDDPQNVQYARAHWVSLTRLEDAHLGRGDLERAAQINAQAAVLATILLEQAPHSARIVEDFVATAGRQLVLTWLRGDIETARALIARLREHPQIGSRWSNWDSEAMAELGLLAAWIDTEVDEAAAQAWLAAHTDPAGISPRLRLLYHLRHRDRSGARAALDELTSVERQHPLIRLLCARAGSVCA